MKSININTKIFKTGPRNYNIEVSSDFDTVEYYSTYYDDETYGGKKSFNNFINKSIQEGTSAIYNNLYEFLNFGEEEE